MSGFGARGSEKPGRVSGNCRSDLRLLLLFITGFAESRAPSTEPRTSVTFICLFPRHRHFYILRPFHEEQQRDHRQEEHCQDPEQIDE